MASQELSPSPFHGGRRDFATTRWSLVLAAGHRSTAGSRQALAALCAVYWGPLYAYVRRRGFQAAEQIENPQVVDHRADIYALGVVFYEMLTGELPIGRFAPPSAKGSIDARLDDVVHKTLEKEPDRRYQHAYGCESNSGESCSSAG